MSSTALSLIMDFILLGGLGAMLFYAYRLSNALDSFKKYRAEFGLVIQELGGYIEEAQGAIDKLKEATQSSGEELDNRLKDASLLADELQLMNDAGNSLASRLEALAERNRKLAQGVDDGVRSGAANGGVEEFMIQDRDFEDNAGVQGDGGQDHLGSQAEKELYAALRGKKARTPGSL